MNVTSVLSAVASLDLPEVYKVQAACEALLKGTGGEADHKLERARSRSSWPSMVWAAINDEFKSRSLPTRPLATVLTGKNSKRFTESSEVLFDYLSKLSGESDKLKLRRMLPLVIDAGFCKMHQKGWGFSVPMVINLLNEFPAYTESAYPGISRWPGHFSSILQLYRASHPSSTGT